MSQQLYFTCLLGNHHHIKISLEPHELDIEAINLEASAVSSHTIKKQDLDPKNANWFESLDELYKVLFRGLYHPSEKIKITITEQNKFCLYMVNSEETAELFEFQLKGNLTTTADYLEKLSERIADDDKNKQVLETALRKSQLQNQQMNDIYERLRKLEETWVRTENEKNLLKISLNNHKTISEHQIKKLETNYESSQKTLKLLEEEIKISEQKQAQLNEKLEEAVKAKKNSGLDDFELVTSAVVSEEEIKSDNEQRHKAIKECEERFKAELERIYEFVNKSIQDAKEGNEELLKQNAEKSAEQYTEAKNKLEEVLNQFENLKENFARKEENKIDTTPQVDYQGQMIAYVNENFEKIQEKIKEQLQAISREISIDIEEKLEMLSKRFEERMAHCQSQIDALQNKSLSTNGIIEGLKEDVKNMKREVDEMIEMRREEDLSVLEAKLEALKEGLAKEIDCAYNGVQEDIEQEVEKQEMKILEVKESLLEQIRASSNNAAIEALKKEFAVQRIIDISGIESQLESLKEALEKGKVNETSKGAELAVYEDKLQTLKAYLLREIHTTTKSVKEILEKEAEAAEQRALDLTSRFEEIKNTLEGKLGEAQESLLEKVETVTEALRGEIVGQRTIDLATLEARFEEIKEVFDKTVTSNQAEEMAACKVQLEGIQKTLEKEIQTCSNGIKEALKNEAAEERAADLAKLEARLGEMKENFEKAATANRAEDLASCKAQLEGVRNSLQKEIQTSSNGVKEALQNEAAAQRDAVLATFEAQIESVKKSFEKEIQQVSNRIEGHGAALVASEIFLKEKIISTNHVLTETMNREIETLRQIMASLQGQNQPVLSEDLARKINNLEKLLKQTFQHFKPKFDSELQYLSEDKRTAENQNMLAVGDKSFFSQNALPDSGKYSFSFKYEQGEFKDDGSLLFGIFPFVNRQKPLISSYKLMVDVLQQEALLGENKVEQFNSGELKNGAVITVYVDADSKNISFAVGGKAISTYPLSNWLNQKMHCGFFIRNNKKFKISFV